MAAPGGVTPLPYSRGAAYGRARAGGGGAPSRLEARKGLASLRDEPWLKAGPEGACT